MSWIQINFNKRIIPVQISVVIVTQTDIPFGQYTMDAILIVAVTYVPQRPCWTRNDVRRSADPRGRTSPNSTLCRTVRINRHSEYFHALRSRCRIWTLSHGFRANRYWSFVGELNTREPPLMLILFQDIAMNCSQYRSSRRWRVETCHNINTFQTITIPPPCC